VNLINRVSSFILLGIAFSFLIAKSAIAANYTLSGKVSDNSGNGISTATVMVNDTNLDSTTTDTNGNYSLSIPEGTYDVQVTPYSGSGFSSAVALSQTISSDTTLNFILTNAGTVTLSGHVYDRNGHPLAGQAVSLETTGGLTVARSTTDTNGNYSIQATSASYQIVVNGYNNSFSMNAPQSYNLSKSYSLSKNTILDIVLPAKKINIHVQDSSANPVNNVGLKAYSNGGAHGILTMGGGITDASGGSSYGQSGSPSPVTDSSGNVILWLFPTDTSLPYTLTVIPPSGSLFQSTTVSNILASSDTNFTVTLPQPVTLSGHVYDALGNPVSNQTVSLQISGSSLARATTNTYGSYSLQASPGIYNLVINANSNPFSVDLPQSYDVFKSNYSLTQNSILDITIPVKKVTIHVEDALGNSLNGAGIKVTTEDGGGSNTNGLSIGGGITDASGGSSYGMFGVPIPLTDISGNVIVWLIPTNHFHLYKFTVLPPSGSSYQQTTVNNVSITTDTLQMVTLQRPATLSGYVYDSLGNTIANQTVMLQGTGGVIAASTTTNSSGSFSLPASIGTYQLGVEGYNNNLSLSVPQTYNISTNYILSQNTTLNIVLPAKKVSIHVQDVNGDPIAGISIKAFNNGGAHAILTMGDNITNASGESTYGFSGSLIPTTDSSGNVVLWLFPNDANLPYTFIATPPTGSIYKTFTLSNISVTSDQTELISLQYSHAIPITSISLSPGPDAQGNYSDPTTVTLSATAAFGYTVMNTYYTLDNGSQQTYSDSFTVSGDGSHTVTYWSVDNSGVPETPNSKTFTILPTYSISGVVYVDANENGFQDVEEVTYEGVTIALTGDVTGSTTTNANGSFMFGSLYAGSYNVTLSVPSGYFVTTTNPVSVPLTADTTVNFGIAIINVAPVAGTITAPIAPVQINTSFTVLAQFTDGNPTDTHTALIDWGDNTTTQGEVIEENGQGTATGTHSYSQAGVYTITVTVTDNHNVSGTGTYQYVTAYDPSAGWVTGSKEFTSPAGALVSDPGASGVASFGFTAKYVGGNLIPIGHKWASLDFKSGGSSVSFNATSYTSLVIMGSKSILRGTGEYNGAPDYSVLATSIDSGTGGVTDYVRYQIKDPSGNVVYDTQPGAVDTEDPTLPVTKGKIDVH
jgi:protocatechuate 3,4-dioxygenase beta subunit